MKNFLKMIKCKKTGIHKKWAILGFLMFCFVASSSAMPVSVLAEDTASSSEWVEAKALNNIVSKRPYLHAQWDHLLSMHVHAVPGSSAVDYAALAKQHDTLKAYLEVLSAVTADEFLRFSKPKQMAYLINSYNAWTLELVLKNWPDIHSIRELGGFFSSPWKKEFIPLFGETVSLDYIEHTILRAPDVYRDARIHFALNCASKGCPALRNEAYRAEKLEQQLNDQVVQFLSDTQRNRIEKNNATLSPIFKWYKDDFKKGWNGVSSVESFILLYKDELGLPAELVKRLREREWNFEYSDYDWGLNGRVYSGGESVDGRGREQGASETK